MQQLRCAPLSDADQDRLRRNQQGRAEEEPRVSEWTYHGEAEEASEPAWWGAEAWGLWRAMQSLDSDRLVAVPRGGAHGVFAACLSSRA